MDTIALELPVLGVRIIEEGVEDVKADAYEGVSYCDAVRLATFGQELLVKPGSIEICKWSPVILGLKEPENAFEKSLQPKLDRAVAGIYLAPIARFGKKKPDAVIVRGRPAQLKELARRLGPDALSTRYSGRIGWTALGVGDKGLSGRVILSHTTNRALGVLKRWKHFDAATKVAFRNPKVTGAFERIAKNVVADMSVCRNSTILPYVEDAGNISFFCTGGVTWGGNSPSHMTSGFPGRMLEAILAEVDFPGCSG